MFFSVFFQLVHVFTGVAMIQGLRLFASAQNLFTISAIKYMDPELRTDNATDAGMDGSAYPQMKNYTLGVNITF